jgi:hypothetical protein
MSADLVAPAFACGGDGGWRSADGCAAALEDVLFLVEPTRELWELLLPLLLKEAAARLARRSGLLASQIDVCAAFAGDPRRWKKRTRPDRPQACH